MGRADVALITTVLNERGSIDGFLASISNQTTLPAEFVVCDGGSTDGTLEVLHGWQAPLGVAYTVIERPGLGIAAGRNVAIGLSRSSLIAVTDAGAEPRADWLGLLVTTLEHGADVASGFFVPHGERFIESVIARVITPLLSEIDPSKFLPSSRSVAFRRNVWLEVGGYPEWLDYCEDLVFDLALRRLGAEFRFVPDAIVSWAGRPSLKAFAKQYWRYARGDAIARLWPKRHAARYAAYSCGIVGLVIATRRPIVFVGLVLGVAAYNAKFVRRVVDSRTDLHGRVALAVALTPIVVSTGDIAKMAGYLAGMVRRRRSDKSCLT